jgi:hypothetical protein
MAIFSRRIDVSQTVADSVRLALNLASACGLGLELPSLAGLDVMAAASKLPKDSRLLNLLFERLERPLDAIGVA